MRKDAARWSLAEKVEATDCLFGEMTGLRKLVLAPPSLPAPPLAKRIATNHP